MNATNPARTPGWRRPGLLPVALLLLAGASRAWASADWQPIDPAELAMTSEPKAPGAPAICLYRQVDRDDDSSTVRQYVRIKVLADAGRKYGDVQLEYVKWNEAVRSIEARTILPDGRVVPFDGTVYDKPVVSARGKRLMAKAFTLPNVVVGSIIEYRYVHDLDPGYVFDSRWDLDDELYTRLARYTLVPNHYFSLTWATPRGVPGGGGAPRLEKGKVSLEVRDVPAFVEEDYMPPEDVLRQRVDFIYREEEVRDLDTERYWKKFGRERWQAYHRYTDEKRAMERALATFLKPDDTPEQKLRRIYERVQQVRNLDFEHDRTEQEQKQEKLRPR